MTAPIDSRRSKWDRRFLQLAQTVAAWSKDPSSQCGCVIVRPDNTIASLGFNGFPRGLRDDVDLYVNREAKLARVIHAEMNAVLSAHESVRGHTAYVWPVPPCDRCAAHLIQAGVVRVVHPWPIPAAFEERWCVELAAASAMLAEAGIGLHGVAV